MKRFTAIALVATGCILSCARTVRAQKEAQPAELPALNKQKRQLEDQRNKINEQLWQMREAAMKDPELAQARQALDRAREAMDKRRSSDPFIKEARKPLDDAEAAVRNAAEAELAADPEVAGLRKDLAAARDAVEEWDFQQRLANFILAECRRRAEKDPNIRRLRADAQKADQEFLKDPRLVAASEKMQAAWKAWENGGRGRNLHEKWKQAERDYYELMRSPKLADARQAKEQAWERLEQAVSRKVAATDRGAEQLRKLDKAKQEHRAARAMALMKEDKLNEARNRVLKDNARIAQAARARDQAAGEFYKFMDEQLKDMRAERERAGKHLNGLVNAKLAEDPKAVDLQKQLDDLNRQINEVNRKLHMLQQPRRDPAGRG